MPNASRLDIATHNSPLLVNLYSRKSDFTLNVDPRIYKTTLGLGQDPTAIGAVRTKPRYHVIIMLVVLFCSCSCVY